MGRLFGQFSIEIGNVIMAYPAPVIEAKKYLEDKSDVRLGIMKLLMGAREGKKNDIALNNVEHEKMWKALFSAEKRRQNTDNNEWVFAFINDVISAKNMPAYIYQSNEDRKRLVEDIFKYTKFLKRIYQNNHYDHRAILNDRYLTHGFKSHDTDRGNPKVSVSDVLDFYAESLASEIGYADRIRVDCDIESRIFVQNVGKRNIFCYGQPLNETVGIVSWAIYGRFYTPSSVTEIINRDFKGYMPYQEAN